LLNPARHHSGCAGIYGTFLEEGIVCRNDPICVV
jgi:hypothetical protein